MITLTEEKGKTYAELSELKRWEKNPKELLKEDERRLREQVLDLGQYKPLLVLGEDVTVKGDPIPAGTIVGGNSRFLVYSKLVEEGVVEFSKVWVSVLGFHYLEAETLWYPVVNGKVIDRRKFTDPQQIIIEYSQSDNDQAGTTDQLALKELVSPYQEVIPMANYKIQVMEQAPLKEIVTKTMLGKSADDDKGKSEEKSLMIKFTPLQYEEVAIRIERMKNFYEVSNITDLFVKMLETAELAKQKAETVEV